MLIIRISLLFTFLSTLVVTVTPSQKIDYSKLPQYLPKGALERLISAKEENFYSNLGDVACSVEDYMTRDDRLETFHDNNREPTCQNAILKTIFDFASGKEYARKMRDSMGRQESGLLRGNFLWLGNYFECKDASGKGITGQMCKAVISSQPNSLAGLFVGICVPDVCTPRELTELFQLLITSSESSNGTFVTVLCPPTEMEFETSDIIAIVICSLLGALVVGGTIFELTRLARKRGQTESLSTQEATSSVAFRLGLSFSVIKNTRTLFDLKRKEGNIDALDGLRFISMAWIILGHTFTNALLALDNIVDVAQFYVDHGSLQAIANSTYSVDTFFFLSGLLVAYLGFRHMDKNGGKLNVPLMYLSRYLRLTPAMALVILLTVSFYDQIGDGPIYYGSVDLYYKQPCQKYWWTNLLYINNLYPPNMENLCIGWVWYLANDMQFYLLSPIFLYLFYRIPRAAYGVVTSLILISMGITGGLSAHYSYTNEVVNFGKISHVLVNGLSSDTNSSETSPTPTEDTYWDDLYTKPWCRIGVYLIGMTTGYILHVTRRKIKMNKIFVIAMWATVFVIELALIYGFCGAVNSNYVPPQAALSFYDAVSRPVWGLGLAWVTIACATGHGGPINKFLSWRVFAPLSRLTYCAYLIHPLFVSYIYLAREYEIHFQLCIVIYYFLAALIFSYALAYVLSMIVEAPMGGIQKVIFPKSAGRLSTNTKPKQNGVVLENALAMSESVTTGTKTMSGGVEYDGEVTEINNVPPEWVKSDHL